MEDDKYKVFNGRDLDKKYDRVVDMTIEQFKNGVIDGTLAYEVILSEMVPIYDRDHKLPGATAKELEDADQTILTEGIAALRQYGVLMQSFIHSQAQELRGRSTAMDIMGHL